jgi:hypothetical protein
LLELIHFDVFSPIKVPLKFKALYYVSIIDDHSKRTWTYFLRTTYEAFIRFKEFKALLENKFGRKIKVSLFSHDGLDVEALERLKEEEENPPQTLFSNTDDPRSKK